MRKIHYLSGLIIAAFVALHLFNHAYSIFGADKHIEIMNTLRYFYRNIFMETVLLCAVFIQIFSGLNLFKSTRKATHANFDKLHHWSGLYLAFFLFAHVSVVLTGRFFLHLDTNFYFGVAGLNTFPLYLFFIPYYGLAMIAFFAHIAAVHSKKMKLTMLGLTPAKQAIAILIVGLCLTIMIFYGLTDHFRGVPIPAEYNVLIGR